MEGAPHDLVGKSLATFEVGGNVLGGNVRGDYAGSDQRGSFAWQLGLSNWVRSAWSMIPLRSNNFARRSERSSGARFALGWGLLLGAKTRSVSNSKVELTELSSQE